MKKIILLPLFAMLCAGAQAQDSTALYQNFNLCDSNAAGEHFPPGWSAYSVIGSQEWKCYDEYGVNNSACLQMNGYEGGSDNQNENWVFTPKLNLSGYTGSIYMSFAAQYFYAGDSLHIMVSSNYTSGNPDASGTTWTELSHYGVMQWDTSYNTDIFWEFQVNLTSFKSSPCTVAFKYTSSDTTGSRWDIDSVVTTTTAIGTIPSTGIANIAAEKLPVTVIGFSTPNEVNVGFSANPGQYDLAIFDLMGRKVYSRNVVSNGNYEVLPVNDLQLVSGMYILKIGNENNYGLAKFVVQ